MTTGPMSASSLSYLFPIAGIAAGTVVSKLAELVEAGFVDWVMIPEARGQVDLAQVPCQAEQARALFDRAA